ncbi:arylesterase [Pseudoalteromonas fenneropenaei]|uniref:Arylesterase n=1 Tax=Pseudoalteromonas fenneropenaei TaxID=1737459 RepID=A0ABV7CFV7_9GAMM
MTRKFLLILTVFLLPCFSLFAAPTVTKIMLVGDSLSAGYGLKQEQSWVYLLQNKYVQSQEAIEIINTSVSGQTTDNALLKLQTQLATHQPSHVLIELGGNDGLRGFPIKVLKQNLRALAEQSQQSGASVAIMAVQVPPNLGPRYTQLFAQSFADIANETQSYLMPFFMTEIATDPTLMQNDNLHPNAKAQPQIADFMAKEIATWLNKTN